MNKMVRVFILAACICAVVSVNAFSAEEAKTESAKPEAVVSKTVTSEVAAKVEPVKPVVADEYILIDTNADGTVTVEEYTAFLTKKNVENAAKGAGSSTEDEIKSIVKVRFEKMDINKDGVVTREEYGTFWVK